MRLPGGDDLKGQVILVAAHFTGGHRNLLGEGSLVAATVED
jgi:hypothetical protein